MMRNIVRMLSTTDYNGKLLFDGSLASANGTIEQGLPAVVSPLRTRVGTLLSDFVVMIIPRLLPGNGTSAYKSVPGVFTPLISISQETVDAKAECTRQLQEIINECTGITGKSTHSAATPTAVLNSISALGNAAANADKLIIQAAAEYAQRDEIAQLGLAHDNQLLNANKIVNAVMLAALNESQNFLDQETLSKIKIVFTCGDMLKDGKIVAMKDNDSTSLEYRGALMQKLEHSVTNDFGRKLFEAAKSLTPGKGDNITTYKLALFNAMIALACPCGPTGAGEITTPEGRRAVDILLGQACKIINGLASHVSGQKRNIKNSIANLHKVTQGLKAAADSYLKTDIAEATERFKGAARQNRALVALLLQQEQINQANLKLIESGV